MSNLDEIIQVTILRETKPTSQQGFSTVLILSETITFAERIKFYNSNDISGMASDLAGGTSDPVYIAALAIQAQNPKIPTIALGRHEGGATTVADNLDAIKAESEDFYGIVYNNRTDSEQLALAAWCQANERLACVASSDTDIIGETDPETPPGSIAAQLKAASYDRTSCIYKSDAATKFTDAAYLGQVLAYTVGSWTGFAKTLAGEAVDNLSTTERKNAHDKFCNTYEEFGEVNVLLNGWVSNGEYTDIIVFVDWLKARIQENIWSKMINSTKIPYTDEGISTVENAIAQILKIAQDNGAVTPDNFDPVTKVRTGGFEISVPLAADVPVNDKANRILKNVTFTCWYSGAIHKVEIQGTVVL